MSLSKLYIHKVINEQDLVDDQLLVVSQFRLEDCEQLLVDEFTIDRVAWDKAKAYGYLVREERNL